MANDSNDRSDDREERQTPAPAGRMVWPDIVRAVAIVAMIAGHAADVGFGTFGARTLQWQVCNFYDSLVRFSVPVFVMVSGMFLLNPRKEYDLKKLYSAKILRMATAFFFWSTFYSIVYLLALRSGNGNRYGHDDLYIFVRGVLFGHFHMWFILMISGLYIVTPVLRQIAANEKITLYFLVLGLGFVCVPNMLQLFPPARRLLGSTISRLEVNLVAGYSCYFMLGYWLSTHPLPAAARKAICILGILAAIGTVVLNGFMGYHFNVTGRWMYKNLLPNILLISVAVFVFCRYHRWQLSASWQKFIGAVGRWGFGIYLVHAFFLDHMSWFGLPHFFCHPAVSIPVTTAFVFFASLGTVFLLEKIPVINKYII